MGPSAIEVQQLCDKNIVNFVFFWQRHSAVTVVNYVIPSSCSPPECALYELLLSWLRGDDQFEAECSFEVSKWRFVPFLTWATGQWLYSTYPMQVVFLLGGSELIFQRLLARVPASLYFWAPQEDLIELWEAVLEDCTKLLSLSFRMECEELWSKWRISDATFS